MKVEVSENKVRIKGELFGKEKHLLVYCSQHDGNDYYSISLIKGDFEIGCLPSVTIDSDNVVITNNLPMGKSIH